MKTQFFIKVNRSGSVSVSKGKPSTDFDQMAVCCNLDLPDVLFQKPQITASIKVDDDKATPFTIDAITYNNVKEAIEATTGMEVRLTIEQAEPALIN